MIFVCNESYLMCGIKNNLIKIEKSQKMTIKSENNQIGIAYVNIKMYFCTRKQIPIHNQNYLRYE